jgi:hypothetical protein
VLGLLVALGLIAAACSTTPSAKQPDVPQVLGQESGTPAVVGQPAPAGTGQLDAVSCADAAHCWAVGTTGPGPTAGSTTASSTPTAVIDATVDGGRTWIGEPLTFSSAPDLSAISCPTVRLCMAVGSSGSLSSTGIVLTTRDGGAVWQQAATPAGAIVLTSVTCTGTTATATTTGSPDCTAIADDGVNFWSAQSTDFGHTWQRQGNLPAGLQDPGGLWCATGTCLVTGSTPTTTGHGQGAIVISTDGGAMWAAADVPAGTGLLQGATCPAPASCLAVGTTSTTVSAVVPAKGTLLMSDDGGHTWIPSTAAQSIGDIFAIDCPGALVCAMVGTKWTGQPAVGSGAVAESSNGGASFTAASSAYTPLALTALDCPTLRLCVAVGSETVARIALPKLAARPTRPGRRIDIRSGDTR